MFQAKIYNIIGGRKRGEWSRLEKYLDSTGCFPNQCITLLSARHIDLFMVIDGLNDNVTVVLSHHTLWTFSSILYCMKDITLSLNGR